MKTYHNISSKEAWKMSLTGRVVNHYPQRRGNALTVVSNTLYRDGERHGERLSYHVDGSLFKSYIYYLGIEI